MVQSNYRDGLVAGRVEGEKAGIIKVAKQMKRLGMAIQDIQTATGLDEEFIKTLFGV